MLNLLLVCGYSLNVKVFTMGITMYEREESERKLFNGYFVVTSEKFREYTSVLVREIIRGRFVIVIGPKGVGKSFLVREAVAKAIQSGFFVAYEVGQVDARSLLMSVNPSDGFPIVFYDPSAPIYYDFGRAPKVRNVVNDVKELIWTYRLMKVYGRFPSVFVVLSDDVYNVIKEDVEETLKEEGVEPSIIKVDLRQEDFLTNIVRIYSFICCREHYEEAGKLIAERYDDNYALVARYAGEWLRQTECGSVEEAIEVGDIVAKAFMVQYIYTNILAENANLAKWLTNPRLEEELKHLSDSEREFVKRWITQRHGGLIGATIAELVHGGLSEKMKKLVNYANAKGLKSPISGATVKIVERVENAMREK